MYDAYTVIKEMSDSGSATSCFVELAERALFVIANYKLLARIYANRLKLEMKERGVKVAPGSNWLRTDLPLIFL